MRLKNFLKHLLGYLEKLHAPIQLEHSTRLAGIEKITRDDIVQFLEKHESHEIEIVHKNLDNIDLSGLDLSGATFYRCTFRGANFSNTILRGAELPRSYFRDVDLANSIMIQADFSDAYIRNCNLANSSLYRAVVDRVDFRESNLANVNLYRASLSDVKRLTPLSLGYTIVQDSSQRYGAYFRWLFARENDHKDIEARIKRVKNDRLIHGEYVYRLLKVVFAENGQYADSSWAYIRERQIRRQRHNPFRAKHNFSPEYPENGRFKLLRRFVFYFKHFWLWVLDWLAEVSCGYGEKPFLTIFWAAMTLIVFPFIYMASGGISGPRNWLDYFNYSLAAFTTLGFEQFTAETSLAQTITSIEAILGISILALLMFVLGNRISRG